MALSQTTTIGGRPAQVSSLGRVRSKVGRSFYNLMSVRFLDNGEYHSMGAGEYAKWADRREKEWINRLVDNLPGGASCAGGCDRREG